MVGSIDASANAQAALTAKLRSDPNRTAQSGPGQQTNTSDAGKNGDRKRVQPAPGSDASRKSDTKNQARGDQGQSPKEKARKQELQREDQETRQHERAHKRVGGEHAGAVQYDYETGPDGKRYAVSGEVQMDTSEIRGDPQATIDKLKQVIDAALAPAQPSSQDRSVAAQARAKIAAIQSEIQSKNGDETDQQAGRDPLRSRAGTDNAIEKSASEDEKEAKRIHRETEEEPHKAMPFVSIRA